ncbi:MAG: MFS transporter, partial [Bacteroidales bacterium]
FYEENGLNNFELLTLHAVYSITIFFLEIPSGYIADIWGRKKSLVLGTILGTLGFSIYSITYGFWGFLIAELALGIGQSFISGSDSAMLYDSLIDMKKEKHYMKYEGRITGLGNFAEAAAGLIISGLVFIGLTTFRISYYCQTLIAFTGIPAALLLAEPRSHKRLVPENIFYIFKVIKYTLIENIKLQRTVIYSSVIGFTSLTMAWFAQIYFFEAGLPETLFGVLWTLLNITVGIGSFYAYKIERKLKMKSSLVLILFLYVISFIFLGFFMSLFTIGILFIFYFARGLATPVLKQYINKITASEIRATVLSTRSLILRLFYAILGPFFGWISDVINLGTALIMCGITIMIMGTISLSLMLISYRGQRPRGQRP